VTNNIHPYKHKKLNQTPDPGVANTNHEVFTQAEIINNVRTLVTLFINIKHINEVKIKINTNTALGKDKTLRN
jgi:hypothetical protein